MKPKSGCSRIDPNSFPSLGLRESLDDCNRSGAAKSAAFEAWLCACPAPMTPDQRRAIRRIVEGDSADS